MKRVSKWGLAFMWIAVAGCEQPPGTLSSKDLPVDLADCATVKDEQSSVLVAEPLTDRKGEYLVMADGAPLCTGTRSVVFAFVAQQKADRAGRVNVYYSLPGSYSQPSGEPDPMPWMPGAKTSR